jgi:glucokinase
VAPAFDDRFVEAFRDKGRLRPLLESIPVRLVLDDRVALWGAAAYAMTRATPVTRPV